DRGRQDHVAGGFQHRVPLCTLPASGLSPNRPVDNKPHADSLPTRWWYNARFGREGIRTKPLRLWDLRFGIQVRAGLKSRSFTISNIIEGSGTNEPSIIDSCYVLIKQRLSMRAKPDCSTALLG